MNLVQKRKTNTITTACLSHISTAKYILTATFFLCYFSIKCSFVAYDDENDLPVIPLIIWTDNRIALYNKMYMVWFHPIIRKALTITQNAKMQNRSLSHTHTHAVHTLLTMLYGHICDMPSPHLLLQHFGDTGTLISSRAQI